MSPFERVKGVNNTPCCCLIYIINFLYNIRNVMVKFEEGLTIIAEKYFSLDENLANLFDAIGEEESEKM